MMPDASLLTGFALSALGFASILTRPGRGGVCIGLGLGIGFLSKGLLAPGVMGVTALAVPVLFPQWRTVAYGRGMAIAAAVATPCLLIWPLALYLRSPALFMEWFCANNIGRFVGFSVERLGTEHLPWFWTKTIPWFTFPALPLALWSLWRARHTALREPGIQYCVIAFGVLMALLAVSSSGRAVYAWPLIVPLAILAAPGAMSLSRRANQLWAGSSFVLFGLLSATIWTGWLIMMLTGAPPAWPRLPILLPADFIRVFSVSTAVLGVLVSVGSLSIWQQLRKQSGSGLAAWTIGLTLTWSLLMTLWTPWLDYAKSYRSVFMSMPIPPKVNCVASVNLGEGERAMLRYVTGHNPVRQEVAPAAPCRLLLVQREAKFGEPEIDPASWEIGQTCWVITFKRAPAWRRIKARSGWARQRLR